MMGNFNRSKDLLKKMLTVQQNNVNPKEEKTDKSVKIISYDNLDQDIGWTLNSLGNLSMSLNDFAAAQKYFS